MPVELNGLPSHHPEDGSEAWICFKCPAVICVWCYATHTEKEHMQVINASLQKKNKKKK